MKDLGINQLLVAAAEAAGVDTEIVRKVRTVVVERGEERFVRVNGQDVRLVTAAKASPFEGKTVVVGKGPTVVGIGEEAVVALCAPRPPSKKQIHTSLVTRLLNTADAFEDAEDAKRLDVPVEEIKRRRKARLEGKFDFPACNPCRICGKETVPEASVRGGDRWSGYNNRRGYYYDYDVLGSGEKYYTCRECYDAGLVGKVRLLLSYYVPTKQPEPYCYPGYENRETTLLRTAVAEYNDGLAYLDTGGNFRYKDAHGKPITAWNAMVKGYFKPTDDFFRYCEQRRLHPDWCYDRAPPEGYVAAMLAKRNPAVRPPSKRRRMCKNALRWRKGTRRTAHGCS